jgi:hypothetical protein
MEKSEAAIQSECFMWFWNTYPNERGFLHANNNNSFNAVKGNQNKAMGVVAGVADMEYLATDGQMVFIEMKTPNGSQDPKQRLFQVKVESRGARYVIIRSLKEFQALMYQYYLPSNQLDKNF